MSNNTTRDTEEFLTSSTTAEGVVEHDGTQYPITVEVPSIGEIQRIEDAASQGQEAEFDALRGAIDDYLVAPDLDAYDVAVDRVEPLFEGMLRAWTGSDEIDMAMTEVETGNRQPTSRPSRSEPSR